MLHICVSLYKIFLSTYVNSEGLLKWKNTLKWYENVFHRSSDAGFQTVCFISLIMTLTYLVTEDGLPYCCRPDIYFGCHILQLCIGWFASPTPPQRTKNLSWTTWEFGFGKVVSALPKMKSPHAQWQFLRLQIYVKQFARASWPICLVIFRFRPILQKGLLHSQF